jgi:hypothetical protein
MADDHSPTDSETADRRDYRAMVFLPQTPFPMRAGLPRLEPEILERWDKPTFTTPSATRGRPTAGRCSCCTTARPTPMGPSTSATP